MTNAEVVIVGAGPYGLVAAAHMRAAGIEPVVFGDVMGFWRAHPKGMLLRSEWTAAHFTDPAHPRRLGDYEIATNQQLPVRIPMTEFTRYGEWFQRESVPSVDPRMVASIERTPDGFFLRLSDGDWLESKRVVVATGLTGFAHRPHFARDLPPELATHTAEVRDFSFLAGKNVAVLGCGQSSLESTALLRDVDAQVEVIARQPIIRWLSYSGMVNRERGLLEKLLRPPGALGPIGLSWIVQIPELYRAVPETIKPPLFARALRPAGSGWLRDRVNGVTYTVSEAIESVSIVGGKLHLRLASGGKREVDHLVLGSGYKIRVAGYSFLSDDIVGAIETIREQPAVGRGFESTVPGLHFIGPASDQSFGPLLHSVAGTEYAAQSVARAVTRKSAAWRRGGAPVMSGSFGAAPASAVGPR